MLIILADGSSKGNPGPIQIGIVIWHRKKGQGRIIHPTHTISKWYGAGTVNEAEYSAIAESLKYVIGQKICKEEILVYSDSQVVINQITSKYKIVSENLIEWHGLIRSLIRVIQKHKNTVEFNWVPRQLTMLADKEARRRLFNE